MLNVLISPVLESPTIMPGRKTEIGRSIPGCLHPAFALELAELVGTREAVRIGQGVFGHRPAAASRDVGGGDMGKARQPVVGLGGLRQLQHVLGPLQIRLAQLCNRSIDPQVRCRMDDMR